jgi:hypothetical protein
MNSVDEHKLWVKNFEQQYGIYDMNNGYSTPGVIPTARAYSDHFDLINKNTYISFPV